MNNTLEIFGCGVSFINVMSEKQYEIFTRLPDVNDV